MDMSYDMIQDLYITQDLLAEMVRWFLICHDYKNTLIFLKSFFHCERSVIIRVATAQGKQGIWFLLFPDRENTGNLVLTQGKIC